MTAAPPSCAFGCQVRVTLLRVTSVTTGFWGGPGSWYGSETGATERLPLSVKIRLGYSMPSKLSFSEVWFCLQSLSGNSCRFRICLDLWHYNRNQYRTGKIRSQVSTTLVNASTEQTCNGSGSLSLKMIRCSLSRIRTHKGDDGALVYVFFTFYCEYATPARFSTQTGGNTGVGPGVRFLATAGSGSAFVWINSSTMHCLTPLGAAWKSWQMSTNSLKLPIISQ